jgi:hypothetical protein
MLPLKPPTTTTPGPPKPPPPPHDPWQRVLSFRIFHLLRENARFMPALDSRCNFVTPEQEIRSAM